MLAIDPRRPPTRPVRSLSDAFDRIGPAVPGPVIAELRRGRAPTAAPAARAPRPEPGDTGVAGCDWELLFDAAMARLRGLVDGLATRSTPTGPHSPLATGSLHDDLLDCTAALDLLHTSITRERARCHQRASALFESWTVGPSQHGAGGRSGAHGAAHSVAPRQACLACAGHRPA